MMSALPHYVRGDGTVRLTGLGAGWGGEHDEPQKGGLGGEVCAGATMTAVEVDAWDLRHLLLSLEERARDQRDSNDLDAVAARAIAALARIPARPPIIVPGEMSAPMVVEGLPLWILEGNGWLLAPRGAGGDCVVVDVPPSPEALVSRIDALGLNPVAVLLTHGHVDHAGGAGALLRILGRSVPVHVHPADRDLVLHPERDGVMARVAPDVCPPPANALVPMTDGATLIVGGVKMTAVHTPGHTPGSVCLLVEGGARPLLFSGDTLFAAGTGRCDLPGGSRPLAEESLRSLIAPLADETVVLPGHGGITTIGAERDQLTRPPLAA